MNPEPMTADDRAQTENTDSLTLLSYDVKIAFHFYSILKSFRNYPKFPKY